MKKKLTMLLASLFLVLGTAWAGTVITDVTQLSNNKVYSIVPKDVTRGVMYATSTSTHLDACGGTANNARNPSVVINEEDSNQQFALYTHNENIYLFSVGAGKFVSAVDNKFFPFVEQPGNPVSVVASDTEGYFTIKVQGTEFVNVSTGWSYGCVGGWNSTDDGNRLQIVEVSEIPAATLQQLTEAFKEPTIEAGKMFALRENTTGLFLDIQTLGIHETGYTTNSMSLNVRPCIIYFEEGEDGKWRMRNVNGTYAGNFTTGRHWNTTISSTSYDWIIDTTKGYSKIAIAKDASNYIGWDKATNITAGGALYNNAEGDNNKAERIYFTLVEYADLNRNYCVLKSPSETFLSLTDVDVEGNTTKASFQSAASEFYITPSAGAFYLQEKSDINYLGVSSSFNWLASFDFKLWTISKTDDDGWVVISQNNTVGSANLGHDTQTTVGTGVFTNVGDGCFPWQILEKIDCPTSSSSIVNDNYSFASERIWYTAPCNTLRFTLTESGGKFQNGKNRMSLDEFKLYDASGQEVRLTTKNISGNNGKTYDGMLDGVNDKYAGTSTWKDGTEDDWFEITLPTGVDLGGAFSFSFVTENTTMNAKAFCIDILYRSTFYEVTEIVFPDGVDDTPITYDGEAVKVGDMVKADVAKFSPTEIDGEYVLDFIKDDENLTIILIYRKGYYRFAVEAPQDVEVTYDGQDIEQDGKIRISTFNSALFEATDVDGYKWNVVVDEENAIVKLVYSKTHYTFAIDAPQNVEVTYNGSAVAANATFEIATFNAHYFNAPNIEGYYWEIVVDEADATATLKYTQGGEEVNPEAVVNLARRIGGDGFAAKFKFVLDRTMNSQQEVFKLGTDNGKILVKGTTLSAITTGLGWYLNNVAHVNIAWNALNETTAKGGVYVDFSNVNLPLPSAATHACDARYRYYLNYCTFGYSMTSWTWKRWQQEIDWMALHGINMPLQIIGLEEVWRQFLTLEKADGTLKYGYTEEEAMAFVPGPAYTAWWGMNNLQGWGGTGAGNLINTAYDGTVCNGTGGVQDKAWFDRQLQLATDILARQRELGMQPVLPGFSGMVPRNFTTKTGVATDNNGGEWQSFWRPCIIDPNAERFAEIAKDYYDCLEDVMGASQYYSMDPFHEGGSISSGKYSEAYFAIYEAMEKAKAGSQWVIQQWHWTDNQKKSTSAVPAGRLIVLDLFSDGKPGFSTYGGYTPQDAVFCAIPNFGGRSGLMGRLQNVTDNYFTFKGQYSSIKGIGTAPEAIEQTPVTYDLIYQLPWMNGTKPNVAEWVADYAVARYGVDNTVVKEAWSLLRQGPLNYGADGIEGPIEDVWAARPNLSANPASKWGKTLNTAGSTYTKARRQMLIDATYKLLSQSEGINTNEVFQSNYNYDLVEFGGAAMADYAYDLLLGIAAAKNAAGANFATDATYIARKNAFLALIEDVDAFKGTNLNFRLGKWTEEARDAAAEAVACGATLANADWYEFNNARTLITTWTYKEHGLNDYSYRSWQGLMKDVYLPRWQYYFEHGCSAPSNGANGYFFFEWNWAHGMEHSVGQTAKSETRLQSGATGYSYSRNPEGNTVKAARELLNKYIIPVTVNGNTHYAYRYLDNDVSSMATIPASAGTTVDMTPYFGELTGISSFVSDVVDGTVTDLSSVAIKANAADGAHSATITLSDGTKLTFYFSINPAYNGTYLIKYKDVPVFIQYNVGGDVGGSVGYKVMGATGVNNSGNDIDTGLTTDYEADKIFTIVPSGAGYTLSAQGQYLKTTASSGWAHIMFSDQKGDAGTYTFTEAEGLVKLKSTNTSGKASVAVYGNGAWGNDEDGKAKSFAIEEVTSYPLTITDAGMATLCLPFNVVLPEGMVAYDLVASKIREEGGAAYAYMDVIARAGETLKMGTPVIVKADADNYDLAITMDSKDAVGSLPNSLLRGNYVSQTLTQGGDVKKFIFANRAKGVGFYIMDAEGTIGANKCWMEWNMGSANVRSLVIRFADSTDIENVEVAPARPAEMVIYNLAGQLLTAPQKGVNIINGRKVIVK